MQLPCLYYHILYFPQNIPNSILFLCLVSGRKPSYICSSPLLLIKDKIVKIKNSIHFYIHFKQCKWIQFYNLLIYSKHKNSNHNRIEFNSIYLYHFKQSLYPKLEELVAPFKKNEKKNSLLLPPNYACCYRDNNNSSKAHQIPSIFQIQTHKSLP